VSATGTVRDSIVEIFRTDTVEAALPDSLRFGVTEPAIEAIIVVTLEPIGFRFDYEIRGQIALLHQVGPDGTLIVSAESLTEGFEIAVDDLVWVPPGAPPWWSNPWNYGGAGVGVLAGAGVTLTGGSIQDGVTAGVVTFGASKLLSFALGR
jgi:hypothetical protein